MKRYLLATAVAAALCAPAMAHATTILTFGQTGSGPTILATINTPTDTKTTISGTAIPVGITELLGLPAENAFFSMHATSIGAATTVGGFITQSYAGTFSFNSLASGLGTNILSGTFTDATFGSGTSLTLSASDATPGESVTFTSSVLPAADLGAPQGVSLSFASVTPNVHIVGTTMGPFTASVSGDFSATPVPEPMTLGLIGVGMAGLGYVRRSRRTRAV